MDNKILFVVVLLRLPVFPYPSIILPAFFSEKEKKKTKPLTVTFFTQGLFLWKRRPAPLCWLSASQIGSTCDPNYILSFFFYPTFPC